MIERRRYGFGRKQTIRKCLSPLMGKSFTTTVINDNRLVNDFARNLQFTMVGCTLEYKLHVEYVSDKGTIVKSGCGRQ